MYELSVSDSFVAQHFLTVPDPGPTEGDLHSHHFTVETTFRGPEIDEYGYLVDIDAAVESLRAVVDGLRDETLNELPAFEGRNPSVERLAMVLGDRLIDRLDADAVTSLDVSVREDDVASVTHTRELR